jgi:hypothetical protein
MANTKERGKVIKDVQGYKIRIMLESKSFEVPTRDGKTRRDSRMLDSGKVGVYAGRKKLIKGDFKSVTEATEYITNKLVK